MPSSVRTGVDAAQTIEKETGVKGSCEVLPFDAANPASVDELVGVVAVKYSNKINGVVCAETDCGLDSVLPDSPLAIAG